MKNLVILIGNLGADPDVKYTQAGTAVANFHLATTEKFKDKSGEQQEQTEWHRVVTWGRLAELCGEYLHKGSKIFLEGKIATRKWQDQGGNDRWTTEIIGREIKFLDSRSSTPGQPETRTQSTNQQSIPGAGNKNDRDLSQYDIDENVPF